MRHPETQEPQESPLFLSIRQRRFRETPTLHQYSPPVPRPVGWMEKQTHLSGRLGRSLEPPSLPQDLSFFPSEHSEVRGAPNVLPDKFPSSNHPSGGWKESLDPQIVLRPPEIFRAPLSFFPSAKGGSGRDPQLSPKPPLSFFPSERSEVRGDSPTSPTFPAVPQPVVSFHTLHCPQQRDTWGRNTP